MGSLWTARTVEASVPAMNIAARPARLLRRFRRFLESATVTVVDAGGRGGLPPELRRLEPRIDLVTFEPEAEESRRLAESLAARPLASARVLPVALGAEAGERTLHVTRDPGRSSFYAPNPAVVSRFGDAGLYDVVGTQRVPTVTLTSALAAAGVREIDLLKLDVQGAELEVLAGLSDDMLGGTLLVECEVEFVELYAGQPLFRHIDDHLAARGFELFLLNRVFANYGGGRGAPYGRGQMQFADAYYLRTAVEHLPPSRLAKLVFLAAWYGFTDFAHHLHRSHAARLDGLAAPVRRDFDRFFAPWTRDGRGTRIVAAAARSVADRVLFALLQWRRWNGLKTDSDRCYPFR